MEDRQKIIEKLVKIKALAERGIGGEQQTAQVMYATVFLKVFHISLVDDLPSQAACPGTDVDDIVGSTDNLFIVFHYHYRIAQLLQLAEHVYQFVRIAAMQADARFVKNIQAAH